VSELCNYTGLDSTAVISNQADEHGDVYAYSRCHCGEVTCDRGTPQEATQALADHRVTTRTPTPEEGGQ